MGVVAVTVTIIRCDLILILISAEFSVPGARGYLCVFDLMVHGRRMRLGGHLNEFC